MHLDPSLPAIGVVMVAMLVAGFVARRLGQPFALGGVLAGVVLGPSCAGIFPEAGVVAQLGGIGVILLLFFVGLEVSLPRLARAWKIALLGTAAQISASIAFVAVLGHLLDWTLSRILLVGFVISLSSTAVVLRMLSARGETSTPVGTNVVAVLLAQDVAVVPMMLTIGWLAGDAANAPHWGRQLGGALALGGLVAWAARRGTISIPIQRWTAGDAELETVASLVPCIGLALLTGMLGLSSGLGAFVGGILIAMTPAAHRVAGHLKPFEVVFVGLFFVSIGMLLDLAFLAREWPTVAIGVALVFVINTLINAATFRVLGCPWREALYGGALLSQVGEFSFLLAAIGLATGVIGEFSYQLTISVIILTLVLSPPWVAIFRRLTRHTARVHELRGSRAASRATS